MSRSATVELDWGDGRHVFRLAIAQLDELEEKCGVGLPVIHKALISGAWTTRMVREVIRLGLIGGGLVDPPAAIKLVQRYVVDRPWAESVLPAAAILSAALVGGEDDDAAGERKGDGPPAGYSPTSAPTGPQSTAQAPRSASRRKRRGASPSGS